MTEFRKMDRAAFDAWHAQYKAEHGYPLQGRNAATGQLVDVGWTTDYTAPVIDAGVAFFPVDIADPAKRPGQPATKAEYDTVATKLAPVLELVDEAPPVKP